MRKRRRKKKEMVRMLSNRKGERRIWRERSSGSAGEKFVGMGFSQREKWKWFRGWLASAFPGCIIWFPIPSKLQILIPVKKTLATVVTNFHTAE